MHFERHDSQSSVVISMSKTLWGRPGGAFCWSCFFKLHIILFESSTKVIKLNLNEMLFL